MTIDEFLAKHGFPGTPAGDRMRRDLLFVLETRKESDGSGIRKSL